MSRRLLNLINNNQPQLPANKKFAVDLMRTLELDSKSNTRKPSKYYKPSSLKCMRNMYFTRTSAPVDVAPEEYTMIGMADTGTHRHEAIQTALINMPNYGFDWKYLDVAKYVEDKQKFGKCRNLVVKGTQGAETHLIDTVLNLSFRCDGIIRRISTNEDFLFEFKNVTSFKYNTIDNSALEQHYNQVICYCTALDLDKAFITYENRDTCNIDVPEIFEVTPDMKNWLVGFISECEGYVSRMIAPPKCEDTKVCRYCPYKTICKKV
jgi:hypothetical protein